MSALEIETPHGPARVHVRPADDPRGLLVLGHGAGGGVQARDLVAAASAALAEGFTVALVEQPYRVAGRKSPAPAAQLDAAWTAVIAALRAAPGQLAGGGDDRAASAGDVPVITGGRSSGARVACRTAAATGAAGVLCLAFPVHPPGRPEKSRLSELDEVAVPVLVVQGTADPFGMPPEAPGRTLVTVPGNHSLTGDLETLRGAVRDWLSLRV